jgi:uncharacterized membrane protein
MAHCTKCGAAVMDNAGFCAACGAPQSAGGQAPTASGSTPAVPQTAMDENVASALCYVCGWITGLIFFLIDKRPKVRFHAAQSIVVFGALTVFYYAFGIFLGFTFFSHGLAGFSFVWGIFRLVELGFAVLWILLMVKAYQGEKFRVPIAADLADSIFGKA